MFSDISLSRYRLNCIREERKKNMEKEMVEKRAELASSKLRSPRSLRGGERVTLGSRVPVIFSLLRDA